MDAAWDTTVQINEARLKNELDNESPFERNDAGWLETQSMLRFRRITCKHVYLAYAECRKKMLPERLRFLRE